jgi:hypothetical protein
MGVPPSSTTTSSQGAGHATPPPPYLQTDPPPAYTSSYDYPDELVYFDLSRYAPPSDLGSSRETVSADAIRGSQSIVQDQSGSVPDAGSAGQAADEDGDPMLNANPNGCDSKKQ